MNGLKIMAVLTLLSMTTFDWAAAQDTQDGKDILRRSAEYIARLNGYTVDFEVEVDVHVDDEKEQFVTDYTIAFRRPLEASVHMNNRYSEVFFYGTREETTRYVVEFEQVQVTEKTTVPFDLIRGASNRVNVPAVAVFADLTRDVPLGKVLGSEKPIVHVGTEEVNGILCDIVRFDYADFTCDAWIEQGERALIHKVVPDLTSVKESIEERGGDVKNYNVTLTALHWQPNTVTDESLAYQPIEGVEKVAQFYRPQPPAPAEALAGKAAPAITLTQLDGKPFDLASKKGNEIVLLDFWATWCGPCRMGMPILNKVSKEFADKGVRLYAVNLEESEEQITAFLESTGMKELTVVLDKEGSTTQPYMAESIPLMIMIGKDGLVKKVHVGVTPTYEDDIRKELEELTAE
jgi:thiol-disulfide isomerase/thioredoxin